MTDPTTLTVRAGDSYLSPTWAIVVNGQDVDLAGDSGWSIRAQARAATGRLRFTWGDTDGAHVIIGTAQVKVGDTTITTSTLRLYLTAALTGTLRAETLRFDVELNHPTFGPLDDPYRVTPFTGWLTVLPDVTASA